jgi:hypothetical protein
MKKMLIGTVKSDKRSKTLRVEIARLKNLAIHVHISDCDGVRHGDLPPGFGVVDFEPYLNEIAKLQMNGAMSIELEYSPEPDRIEEWVKEGDTYTVTRIVRMGLQKETYGFLLKEVQLSSRSFPYELYDASRFLPIELLSNMKEEEKKEVIIEEACLELI